MGLDNAMLLDWHTIGTKTRRLSRTVNELLLDFARTADDRELVRINPVRFAEQHGLTKGEAIDLFLHARKEGLVTMEWQYVCPAAVRSSSA